MPCCVSWLQNREQRTQLTSRFVQQQTTCLTWNHWRNMVLNKKRPYAVLDEFRNMEKWSVIWLWWTQKGVLETLYLREHSEKLIQQQKLVENPPRPWGVACPRGAKLAYQTGCYNSWLLNLWVLFLLYSFEVFLLHITHITTSLALVAHRRFQSFTQYFSSLRILSTINNKCYNNIIHKRINLHTIKDHNS